MAAMRASTLDQPACSHPAKLTLRAVFYLALRQTEDLTGFVHPTRKPASRQVDSDAKMTGHGLHKPMHQHHPGDTMPTMSKQFRLKARPEGLPKDSDFTFGEAFLSEPSEGEMLVRVLYLSIDPTNRTWMSDHDQYMPPVELGEVMRSLGVGRVGVPQ